MTVKIPLSVVKSLPFNFDKAVRDFKAAKEKHLATVNVPAPRAPHEAVEASVRREPTGPNTPDRFVIDFEIIDDTPVTPDIALLRETVQNGA